MTPAEIQRKNRTIAFGKSMIGKSIRQKMPNDERAKVASVVVSWAPHPTKPGVLLTTEIGVTTYHTDPSLIISKQEPRMAYTKINSEQGIIIEWPLPPTKEDEV